MLYLFEPWAFVTPGKCIEHMQYIEIKFTEIGIKSLSTFSRFIDSSCIGSLSWGLLSIPLFLPICTS